MKNLLLTIFLFSWISIVSAQDLETIMKNGNQFYQNKQYNDAITSYESILKQGYISGDLFYNLGNSYFKIGHLGKSILFYEKALKISPSNEDAAYNLKIANSRTVDKIEEIPTLFFIHWWNILLSQFTSTTWQIIIFIFYILLLLSIGVFFLIRNLQFQKFALFLGTLNIFVLIISIILFISSINREVTNNNGILLQSVISAKISPDIQANDAFVIHEGIKFVIEDKVGNWSKIKLSDGKVGWLPNQSFEEI
ncbi:MAG: tetratricopeptide repeat protein [Melioribacteraceae bacterium]